MFLERTLCVCVPLGFVIRDPIRAVLLNKAMNWSIVLQIDFRFWQSLLLPMALNIHASQWELPLMANHRALLPDIQGDFALLGLIIPSPNFIQPKNCGFRMLKYVAIY